MNIQLSVIIPVYNAEKYLIRCLDSLFAQDLPASQFEIIVVNDGSIDNSLSIIQDYANNYSQIKVITKINGGAGSARNFGLDNATGDFVYFLDPDDYVVRNSLGILLSEIQQNNLDILTFNSDMISESKHKNSNFNYNKSELSEIVNGQDYIAYHKYQNEVWWYIINRKFLVNSAIRFVEGRVMEDAIFTAALFLKAKRMAHYFLNAHKYLIVSGSAMTNTESTHYIRVIKDIYNAAFAIGSLIDELKHKSIKNEDCLNRLKSRQQSLVFFMMVRILKSRLSLNEVKPILDGLTSINAYPLNDFISKDFNNISYRVLVKLFNQRTVYSFLFKICNPLFKVVYFKN